MMGRVLIWSGGAVVVATVVGLALYWGRVGFRLDDALGWIGAVVGIAGLALAVFGAAQARRTIAPNGQSDPPQGGRPGGATDVRMKGKASEKGRVYQAGHDQTNHDA